MYVIATAGHVDHGKSALIRALTGMEPDRWAEERRRAMTIDLGFAWTRLSDGTALAFVDVPGHERFITNMLAGIGPVPAVLLVVAADEGWRQQTGEHVAALEALGVAHGILAVTRSDLGDPAWAIEQAQSRLADTALADIETVAVSAVTNAGIPELRAAIERMVGSLPTPEGEYTRLWVDRVFTIRGAGTVVTGTLGAGQVSVGDELVVAPLGERIQVRALETLKEQVTSASAVARLAVNLRGAKRQRLHRGLALVGPGEWIDAEIVDARLIKATGKLPAHPIVHIGSAAVATRLRVISEEFVRLNLSRAVPLHVGERLLLRDPGQQRVVAGAVVVDVLPPALAGRGAAKARARDLADLAGEPDLRSEVARRHAIRREALWSTGVSMPHPMPGDVLVIGDWLIAPAQWARWQEQLRTTVRAWAHHHPLQPGIPPAAASQALELPDPKLLQWLVGTLPGLASDSNGLHEAKAKIVLSMDARRSLDELTQRLAADPFDAPDAHELAATGLTERDLSAAAKHGELVRVATGLYLGPQALAKAQEVLAHLSQPFTSSEARCALGTTRRVAIPLLELLDNLRATRRIDTQHRIVVPHAPVPTGPHTDAAVTDSRETRP